MKPEIYNLKFITPCFCAGADQTVAELRPSAIRGQLRWWFRALGGTREQEMALFGGIAGENGRSSTLQIRTALIQRGPDWKPPKMSPGQPAAYIWYFASVANDKKRWWKQPPARSADGVFNSNGNIPPESTFQLQLRRLRTIEGEDLQQLLTLSVRSCLRFGGIGMRLTRGMGAWECRELDHSTAGIKKDADAIVQRHFKVCFGNGNFRSGIDAILDGEKWLQHDLRKQFNANRRPASPLGGIWKEPQLRQTSAVYLRPIHENNGYTMFFFEAPHERVLCDEARRGITGPVLQGRLLSGPPPAGQPRRFQR